MVTFSYIKSITTKLDNNIKIKPSDPFKTLEKIKINNGIRIYISLIISLIFLYISLRGIKLYEVWFSIQRIHLHFMILSAFFLIVSLTLRAIRWKFILKPLRNEKIKSLFSVLMIGYFGNNILPARMGELLRAHFLGVNYNFSRMQALATIIVERIFDSLVLLGLFGLFLIFYPFPAWMKKGGMIAGFLFLGALIFLYIYIGGKSKILTFLQSHSNLKLFTFTKKFTKILENFRLGLSILKDKNNILIVVSLTILVWLLDSVVAYCVLLAFDMELPFFAPLLAIVMIGLSTIIPSAPSYIGTFEAFGMLALVPFGVKKEAALSFALIMHFVIFITTISIGSICFLKEIGLVKEVLNRLSIFSHKYL